MEFVARITSFEIMKKMAKVVDKQNKDDSNYESMSTSMINLLLLKQHVN